MKLPNANELEAALARRVVEKVGASRLAECLFVPLKTVNQWADVGVPAGPAAAVMRQMAVYLDPEGLLGSARCVFCRAPAHVQIAKTPVCTTCRLCEEDTLEPFGFIYRDQKAVLGDGTRVPSAVRVGSTRGFERPMFVKFSRQGWRKGDPELGDETFDQNVWIETDDYESVFDSFALIGRRQLVYDLTRTGDVTINVDEVLYEHRGMPVLVKDLPIKVALLAWSLRDETSDPWVF